MISNENAGAKCLIESNGRVNCSTVIYEDERRWKKSRNQVDLLIQALKNKIIELKDIRRHLKENKPKNMTDDDELDLSENVSPSISSEDNDFMKSSMIADDYLKPSKRINGTTKNQAHRVHKPSSTATNEFATYNTSSSTLSSIAPSMKSVLVNHPARRGHAADKIDEHSRRHQQAQRGHDRLRSTSKPPKISTTKAIEATTTSTTETIRGVESSTLPAVLGSTESMESINTTIDVTKLIDAKTASLDESDATTIVSFKRNNGKPTPETDDGQLRTECFCEPDTDEE